MLFDTVRMLAAIVAAAWMAAACANPSAPAAADAGKSAKRGFTYGTLSESDLSTLAPGCSWCLDYSLAPNGAKSFAANGVEFVPMVWGAVASSATIENALPAASRHLLGYCLPQFKSQANLSAVQAAANWPYLEQAARDRGLLVGGPSVGYAPNGSWDTDPVSYLDTFFAQTPAPTEDFIAIVCYSNTIAELKTYVERFKKYGKPIWVTEFVPAESPALDANAAKQYMKDAVAYFESEPLVARYAWYSAHDGAVPNMALLASDGSLTELGKLYINLPH